MKTLKVTLEQHTPLIHFQHDQYGATLRASEVKPKLDRFILTKLGEGDYDSGCEKAKEKGWLIGDKNALNYKMKIVADNFDETIKLNEKDSKIKFGKTVFSLDDFPMLLSNMGGKENKAKLLNFSYSNKDVELTFIFLNAKKNGEIEENDVNLYEIVKSEVKSFFANSNFGQRGTKGFGSFTVIKIDNDTIEWNDNDVYEKDTQAMRFEVDNINFNTIKKVFNVIDFYWKYLKSGVNYTQRKIDEKGIVHRKNPERYLKSFLWTYLDAKGYTWEKRKLKEDLSLTCKRAVDDERLTENNNTPFFARAHLGCPINGFTYRIPQAKLIKDKNGRPIESSEFVPIKIKTEMERIPSPIIFKPVFEETEDKKTHIVSIYILYNEDLRNILYGKEKISDTNFTFMKKDTKTDIPLFVKNKNNDERFQIDFNDLINQFHEYLKNQFIPRDNRWNNILGRNESGEDNVVKLCKIIKPHEIHSN